MCYRKDYAKTQKCKNCFFFFYNFLQSTLKLHLPPHKSISIWIRPKYQKYKLLSLSFYVLNPFEVNVPFLYSLRNHEKPFGFLFPGGIEVKH